MLCNNKNNLRFEKKKNYWFYYDEINMLKSENRRLLRRLEKFNLRMLYNSKIIELLGFIGWVFGLFICVNMFY